MGSGKKKPVPPAEHTAKPSTNPLPRVNVDDFDSDSDLDEDYSSRGSSEVMIFDQCQGCY